MRFLGAITNEQSRTLTVDLARLGAGPWKIRRFADGVPTAEAWRTPVAISDKALAPGAKLTLNLTPSGGRALILELV